MAKLRVEVESESDEPDFTSAGPGRPADLASSSKRDWPLALQDMGFSEGAAEYALEVFNRRRQEPTLSTLVEFLLQDLATEEERSAGKGPLISFQVDLEELLDDPGSGSAEEVQDVSPQRETDLQEQLEELGYERELVAKALLQNRADASPEELVDWLEANTPVSCEVVPEGPEGIIAGLRMITAPERLGPEVEEKIVKYGCSSVFEAMDVLLALEAHDRINNLSASSSAIPQGKQGAATDGAVLEDWDSDEDWDGDGSLDDYDLGSMDPPQAESDEEEAPASAFKKRRTGEKPGPSFSKSCGKQMEERVHGASGRTGFGVPGQPIIRRQLNERSLQEPPFFYFENVAMAPKGEWAEMSRHLYGIEPEFVDSLHFSACRRSRGYIHNLPVEGRRLVIPPPPMSIQKLFPVWGKHWPDWDRRVKMNCINTKAACATTVSRIKRTLEAAGDRILQDLESQRYILHEMKKWNLVWTGPDQVSPMTPEETEIIMGYDQGHTRGIVGRDERLKGLGNSFQVNTVAYHLSVLKPLYPGGMNVISLFSGIGGAEVALHKNGIKINVLVSVDKEPRVRLVVDNWWAVTEQKGTLVHDIHDVKDLTREKLRALVQEYGRFDLLIGGSPCNNLTGNNRKSRTGLLGQHSYMFHDYKRILADLRELDADYARR